MKPIDTTKVATDRGNELICLFDDGTIRSVVLKDSSDWRYDPPTEWFTYPPIPQGQPRTPEMLISLKALGFIVQCSDGTLWQWFYGYCDWYPCAENIWPTP